MGAFSGRMNQTVTVAQPSGASDDYGKVSPGTQSELICDYEQNGKTTRDANGSIVETKDVLLTHGDTESGGSFEPDESTYFWPPGKDPNDNDDAVKPTVVENRPVPSGGEVWEVVL